MTAEKPGPQGRTLDRRDFLKWGGIIVGGAAIGGAALCASGFLPMRCVPKRYIKEIIREGFSDGLYDFNDNLISDEANDKIRNANHLVRLKYTCRPKEEKYKDQEFEEEGTAIGACLGDYLLTARHTVYPNTLLVGMSTPRGTQLVETPIEITGIRHYVHASGETEIEPVYCGEEDDIALFEIPEEYRNGTAIGNSDDIRVGNIIATVGNIYGCGVKTVSRATVSSTVASEEFQELSGIGRENYIMCTHCIETGCSGGGAYAFRDGEPELIGMNHIVRGALGGIVKINFIKSRLSKFI